MSASSIACPGYCCDPVFLSDAMLDSLTDPKRAARFEPEGSRILDMLELIAFGADPNFPDSPDTGATFRCRNFDPLTRLCTVYATRPDMCSAYPYRGESCVYCGMTAESTVTNK